MWAGLWVGIYGENHRFYLKILVHDWIRTNDLFRVTDVKLRHFNLQDPGGSLIPCKHIRHRGPTYCKTYHVCGHWGRSLA
jgi:hypothetical protein